MTKLLSIILTVETVLFIIVLIYLYKANDIIETYKQLGIKVMNEYSKLIVKYLLLKAKYTDNN